MYTGSCLCGKIQFRVDAQLAPLQICHCRQCRKAQGAPVAVNTPVSTDNFAWISGRDHLTEYESSPGKKRCFCKVCGSPVYSCRDALPGVLRLRAGLINEPITAGLAGHFHTASRCDWWPIQDELPQYADAQAWASSR